MCYGEVVSSAIQVARKEGRECASCGRRIVPGATYVMHVTRGYDDGDLSPWKLCRTCAIANEVRWDMGATSCPLDIREDLAESNMAREDLRDRMRAAWKRMRARYRTRGRHNGTKLSEVE